MANSPPFNWRHALDALKLIGHTTLHVVHSSRAVVSEHVRHALLLRNMRLFTLRRRIHVPPKPDRSADADPDQDRPASSASSSTGSSNKRPHQATRQTLHDDESASPPKRRSLSPAKKPDKRASARHSRAPSPSGSSLGEDTSHTRRDKHDNDMLLALALADRLEYAHTVTTPLEQRSDLKSRRAIERERAQQEQLLAQQKLVRLKEDKTKKKKRLAAQRRKLEREHSAKSFKQSKAAYEEYVASTLRPFKDISISDERLTTDKKQQRPRLLKPVNEHWIERVNNALAIRSEAAIVGKSIEGVELSRKDIGRLLPPGEMRPGREPWLNDEVINAWYANLCARLNEKDGYVKGPNAVPRWVAYGTQWYKNASEKGVESIKTWSRRKGIKNDKLLQTEMIFFPVNDHMHWTLLVIGGRARTIQYLDSLDAAGWKRTRYVGLGKQWLQMELGSSYRAEEWQVLNTNTSMQSNSNDCGMFACLNGLALSKGSLDPSRDFCSDDIPNARRMFVATLLNGGFTGDFDLVD